MLVRSLLLGSAVALLFLHGQSFQLFSPGALVDPFTLGDFVSRELLARLDVLHAVELMAALVWLTLFAAITLAVGLLWPVAERVCRAAAGAAARRR